MGGQGAEYGAAVKRFTIPALLLAAGAAHAANPATQLREQYERCAWSSLMATRLTGIEPNSAAEQALFACTTEEQAISVYLASYLPPQQASATMIALRLRLKRELAKTAKGLQ